MGITLDFRMEVRITAKMWKDLPKVYVQYGYKDASSFTRAVLDTIIYGVTDEKQQNIYNALEQFIDQSYHPTEAMQKDFFEFMNMGSNPMLAARFSADEFYKNIVLPKKLEDISDFTRDFTRRYKYAILPRDIQRLLSLYYNDAQISLQLREKYTRIVEHYILDSELDRG